MKMKMKKKGDISIVMLVIGIIAVCFLAIFSFINSNDKISDNFLGIGLIETMNSIEEEQDFYDDKTDFEGNYGNLFERGNVKVNINDENVSGVYVVDEIEFKLGFIPYGFKEKTIINITYDR